MRIRQQFHTHHRPPTGARIRQPAFSPTRPSSLFRSSPGPSQESNFAHGKKTSCPRPVLLEPTMTTCANSA
jgi:hypothetical protein